MQRITRRFLNQGCQSSGREPGAAIAEGPWAIPGGEMGQGVTVDAGNAPLGLRGLLLASARSFGLLVLVGLLVIAPVVRAEVTLPAVFGDHMVLQRDVPVRVWGKAEPGEEIRITFVPNIYPNAAPFEPVVADADGAWEVVLPQQQAGTGNTLVVHGSKTAKPIEIKDVAFGEVWLASGQSNMEWRVHQSDGAQEAIADSANDQIRMFNVAKKVSDTPLADVGGQWQVASPQTTGGFSAVGYYFAQKLQQELDVPVGILHSSWGGTPIESWTSREGLEAIDWARPILDRYDAAVRAFPQAKAEFDRAMKRHEETRNGPPNTGVDKGYAKPDFDDSAWETMGLPQVWEEAGLEGKDGVVWFRKTVEVPEGWAGQALTLSLGPVDDGDTTYVNGQQVGQIPPSAGGAWRRDRVYTVPGELVKAGELTIAVRVVDLAGAGGIWGQAGQMELAPEQMNGQGMPLAGEWKYLLAQELTANNRPTPRPGQLFGPEHPHAPAGLFNGMIAPLTPYTIQGVIWYQGESNASRAEQYEKLFPGMIADWRKQWGQNSWDLPFLFVQLANYRQPTDNVVDTEWAHLRDAQLKTLREVENTGMAVTIDIGAANDIHPRNKKDVGLRLARWALADTYGKVGGLEDEVKSGPIYFPNSAGPTEDGEKILLSLYNFGNAVKSRGDGAIKGFTIAGKDGKFYAADATIRDEIRDNEQLTNVLVWSDQVKDPVAVRYAWEDNPDEANLVNEEGLPASPFRTDDWAGPTDGRR